ncbi:Zinc finger, TFIIS-type [Corchorus capsularis]|uniref:Transcription elongation factor n=1 Tax=Corchorus capsularis TaxID=210143 RepID=A0A1R3H8R5_COCAP|nr:Zinc finger, TFIIS-type [Corchorus capsularis]
MEMVKVKLKLKEEKEVVELFEAAKKAADRAAALDGAASEENRCIDALSQLKHFPITYQLLVSTQVGKQLRCLTNHPRKKIQSFARDVLRIWKNAVIKTNNGDVNNGKMGNKNSLKMEQKTPNNGSQKVAEKTSSMVKCNDELRDKVREQIYDSLCKVLTEAGDDIRDDVNASDPVRAAVSVECAMFENWGKSNGDKRIRYRSTLFNIKDQNNPDFRRKILLGEIKPDKIVSMTTEEMASDRRKLENKQLKEKALFNCQRPDALTATTDQFKCGRCGSRKTTYNQIQTRSADEPMTTYVTCTNCKNCWKFC